MQLVGIVTVVVVVVAVVVVDKRTTTASPMKGVEKGNDLGSSPSRPRHCCVFSHVLKHPQIVSRMIVVE